MQAARDKGERRIGDGTKSPRAVSWAPQLEQMLGPLSEQEELLAAAAALSRGAATSRDRLLRIDFLVNGERLRAIVDTGATGSFVAEHAMDVARHLRARALGDDALNVTYSDGGTAACQGALRARVSLPGGGTDRPFSCHQELYVIKLPRSFDVVLGMDFIHQNLAQIIPQVDGIWMRIREYLWCLNDMPAQSGLPAAPEGIEVNFASIEDAADEAESAPDDEHYVESAPDDEHYVVFVRAGEGVDHAQIEAYLAGTAKAVSIDGLSRADLTLLDKRDDDVPFNLNTEQAARAEALQQRMRDTFQIYEEATFATVAVTDDEVEPLRLTPEGARNPPYEPPRPLNGPKLEALKDYLDQLLVKGFIQPSKSSFGAPVLLVVKTDGTYRFTVDYRRLNDVVERDRFCLPTPDSIFQMIKQADAKVFSAVDAMNSFWQVRLRPEDREKTAMSTPFGLYEWLVCPQGLSNSPGTLQRVLTKALGELVGKCCAVYLDDVIIFSKTLDEHEKHLAMVLERLGAAQIRLKEKKCKFFMRSLEYLGVRLSGDGTAPTTSKIRALLEFPRPENKQDVKSILGVVAWLRGFVPHVATWCQPLQDLANSRQPFTADSWTEEHERCLEVIIHLLITQPVLAIPDARKDFYLMTDASGYAMGCVLLQEQADGLLHPVAYHSKMLKDGKRHKSATDREMEGIMLGVRKWETLLADQEKLTILGDHQPLSHYRTMDLEHHSLIRRQLDRLEALRTNITYATAKEVAMADLLSRDPRFRTLAEQDGEVGKRVHPALRLIADLNVLLAPPHVPTLALNAVTRLRKQLENAVDESEALEQATSGPATTSTPAATADAAGGPSPDVGAGSLPPRAALVASQNATLLGQTLRDGTHRAPDSFSIDSDGLIWYLYKGRRLLFLAAREDQQRALHAAHDEPSAGHLGYKRTLERLQRAFWWPKLREDCRVHCSTCPACSAAKPASRRIGALHSLPIPFRKWSIVGMDYVTINPYGKWKSALVICDLLTKRIRVFPSQVALDDIDAERQKLSAQETARLYFDGIWRHHGLPTRIVSDRDPRFMSAFWQTLWKMLGTHLNVSTAGYAQTDGQSERSIRTFVQMLRSYVKSKGKDNWQELVPALEYAYNDSVHAATGFTPFMLEYGQDPFSPLQLWLRDMGIEDPSAPRHAGTLEARRFVTRMQESLVAARQHVKRYQDSYQSYQNKKRDLKTEIVAGDWIWMENQDRATKLDPLYVGPFKVTAVRGRVVTFARSGRRFAKANLHRVRKFELREDPMAAVSDLRVAQIGDDKEPTHALELLVGGAWAPALQFLEAHQERGFVALAQLLDARKESAAGERVGTQAVGTRLSKKLTGQGVTDGVVIEYDPGDLDFAYRVAYPDDEEDLTEREMLKARARFLKRVDPRYKRAPSSQRTTWLVEEVLGHTPATATAPLRFKVHWQGFARSKATLEPLSSFGRLGVDHPKLRTYLSKCRLTPREIGI